MGNLPCSSGELNSQGYNGPGRVRIHRRNANAGVVIVVMFQVGSDAADANMAKCPLIYFNTKRLRRSTRTLRTPDWESRLSAGQDSAGRELSSSPCTYKPCAVALVAGLFRRCTSGSALCWRRWSQTFITLWQDLQLEHHRAEIHHDGAMDLRCRVLHRMMRPMLS